MAPNPREGGQPPFEARTERHAVGSGHPSVRPDFRRRTKFMKNTEKYNQTGDENEFEEGA